MTKEKNDQDKSLTSPKPQGETSPETVFGPAPYYWWRGVDGSRDCAQTKSDA